MVKMGWTNLKGTLGFCISWIALNLFTLIILFYDLKLGIMGVLLSFTFGFLGFDMLHSLCKKRKAGV